jgi:microcystin degradation protein MlrC
MRVGILGIQHESNTFIATPTTLEDFRRKTLLRGEAIRRAFAGGHHEVSGYFEGLAAERIDAVPIFVAGATPSGVITADALNALLTMLWDALDAAGRLDGILAAVHGAAVSEMHRDMDGHWLTLLRDRVGPAMPIVNTLDPHANVSPRMIAACDASIAYRTNPHLDQRQRGVEAARLMARSLRGEVRPVQAAAMPPVAINIERQLTSAHPCAELFAEAETKRQTPGVLAVSVMLGFPYADVSETGSAFIVVADGDRALAQRTADALATFLINRRDWFVGQMISVDAALMLAMEHPQPVCLLDIGDNVGGGSPGDGTVIAHALHRAGIGPSFVCIFDPQAVAHASAAGIDNKFTMSVGGKTDDRHGPPLQLAVTVRGVHDGKFTEPEARHGGMTSHDMGATVVVESDRGLTIMLTSRRVFPVSLNQLTSCGLDPKSFRIIVAKGVHAPAGAYKAVCPTMIRVNTPGVTTADMSQLDYRHRRRPLFPFEPIDGGDGSP